MPVHVIMGPPCAGKTTYARGHGGDVIDLDDIEEELGGERYAEHSLVREQALQVRRERINAAFESDVDTYLIHTAPNASQVADYLRRGATLTLIDPGIETCLARSSERPDHTSAVIRDWYASHPPMEAGFFMPQAGEHTDSQEEYTMSDKQAQQDVEQSKQNETIEQPKQEADEQEPKTFDETYVKKLRDEAASYRVKLKEIEDRDKSEAEKTAERIAELERENARYKQRDQVQEWAKDIARDQPSLAPLLRGSTREELEEHFEQLRSLTTKPTPKAAPSGKSPADREKPTNAAEALRSLRQS